MGSLRRSSLWLPLAEGSAQAQGADKHAFRWCQDGNPAFKLTYGPATGSSWPSQVVKPTSANNANYGLWVHVGFTLDPFVNNEVVLYMNGMEVQRATLAGSVRSYKSFTLFGDETLPGQSSSEVMTDFEGVVDEVRIFNTAHPLDAFSKTEPPGVHRHEDLVRWYDIDQGYAPFPTSLEMGGW